jgi:response regulator RpfG family c-di-GMP phosphodiesterase
MWSSDWVGERLLSEGLITAAQLRSAQQSMLTHEERMEEALLRVAAIDETRLLRFIAERTRARYVSTAKLARIEVPPAVLDKVPERIAEKLLGFPVRYLASSDTLTLVSPDAGSPEYVQQAGMATGVRHVTAFVARPAAVKAAINKWYKGEIQAFASIEPDTFTQLQSTVDLYERHVLEEDGLASARPGRRSEPFGSTPSPPSSRRSPRHSSRPPASRPGPKSSRTTSSEHLLSVPTAPTAVSFTPDRRLIDLAEMLNVLVALNENGRDEFRGHSASVARLGRMIAQRMGLDELAQIHISIAANLHDVGKTVSYHLTTLNVAQYGGHHTAAEKMVLTPVRLLESVGLPAPATDAVACMYERYDGEGFPARLSGKSIPLMARVLSLCDTYSDLTQNPRNPYRKALSHAEAQAVLSRLGGTLFDPDLVELLGHLIAGEDLRRQLSDETPSVLLVEPNVEEATVIELRLVAQGFQVTVARNADEALRIAEGGGAQYVLSEVELAPFDGFELLSKLRAHEATSALPFFFVARASDTASIDRGFALGAQDYVVKPTSGDVLAGKLRRLSAPLARKGVSTGVAGSLSEMGLPDLAQILGAGRKSGRLSLQNGDRRGEVDFESGLVVHASAGELAGNEAFYELLAFDTGTFAFDPSFHPTAHTVSGSAESLILEGLRRLDERRR